MHYKGSEISHIYKRLRNIFRHDVKLLMAKLMYTNQLNNIFYNGVVAFICQLPIRNYLHHYNSAKYVVKHNFHLNICRNFGRLLTIKIKHYEKVICTFTCRCVPRRL